MLNELLGMAAVVTGRPWTIDDVAAIAEGYSRGMNRCQTKDRIREQRRLDRFNTARRLKRRRELARRGREG